MRVRGRPVIALLALVLIIVGALFLLTEVNRQPPVTGMYGSAFAMDSKNNYQVGWTVNQRVAHRFRAGTTSQLVTIALNQRGGPGYSGGNGGSFRVTIESDNAGRPSGTVLASLSITPGNPSGHWENHTTYRFATPATLTAGVMYHVVFTNTDASPATNYISVNEAWQYYVTSPRQPSTSDEVAVLLNRGSGWTVAPNDTPVMDLGYANGVHDGNAYSSVVADYYSIISGTQMARERLTVSGPDRSVTSATVRVKRISGTSPLTVRLETSGGTVLATGTTSATQIPLSTIPTPLNGNSWDEASLAGGRWVTVTFASPVVLRSGSTYNVRLSTSADTTFVAVPIRELDDVTPIWASRAFRDGFAQRTSDGSTWADVYAYGRLDLQFYLD